MRLWWSKKKIFVAFGASVVRKKYHGGTESTEKNGGLLKYRSSKFIETLNCMIMIEKHPFESMIMPVL